MKMSESRYRKNLDPDVEKCSEFPPYYQELHRCRMHSTPPVVFFTLSEEVTRGGKLSWVSSFSSANKRQNKKQPTARGGAGGNCVDFLLQYCEGGASFTRILCSVLYSVNFIKKPTKKCGRI